MNGIQMVSAGGSIPSAHVVNAGTAGGQAQGGAAFAALMNVKMAGESNVEGQGLSLAAFIASNTAGNAVLIETAAEETEGSAPWEAVLEQLEVWLGALTPEQRQQLAANAEVKQWAAMAEAELAMAGAEQAAAPGGVPYLMTTEQKQQLAADGAIASWVATANAERSITGNEGALRSAMGDSTDGFYISDILKRFMTAMRANPEQPYLSAAVEQGKTIMTQAITAAEAVRSAGTEIERLLTKMNGQVVQSATPKTEGHSVSARMSHLTAIQAKSSYIHYVSAEKSAMNVNVEAVALTAEGKAAAESNGIAASTLEAMKASGTETSVKADPTSQRIPLSTAAEHLNEWLMKQATGGPSSFKTETVIKLLPEHLGQVEVRLSIQNGQLAATITTESAMAKEVLESNLASLRSNLQNQGVTVEKLVVSQQNGFQSGMFQDGRQRQSSGRDSARDQRSPRDESSENWAEVLGVNADEAARNLALSYESSFQAEA
jgi:flagellar hook-length control protein FliK